jgi:hypothetical protein
MITEWNTGYGLALQLNCMQHTLFDNAEEDPVEQLKKAYVAFLA